MGTLTSLYNVSLSALEADQAALNVTANNVANQNTVGYTRETVNFQATDSVTLNGVVADGVSSGAGPVSQRDRVLEQRVQQQTQVSSQSSAIESALSQVESIFGVSSTATSASSTAIGSAIDGLWSAFSSLSSNPSGTATRQNVLNAANTFANAIGSAANQLAEATSNLNQQAVDVVGQVNSLTATIASLNQQISTTSPDSDAGTLEDQRQAAIAKLSQYIGLDQISTGQNGITLTTTNGALLVGGDTSYPLSTTMVLPSGDPTLGGIIHILGGTNNQDLTSSISGGQLGGILQVRDSMVPSYSQALEKLDYSVVTTVNSQNSQGVDLNGNAGQPIFSIWYYSGVSMTDPNGLAAASSGEGSAGNSNAEAFANLATATIAGGQTASGYFAQFLSKLGTDASNATGDSTAQSATLTQLTTQRDSLSGVSLDQEAANLTQYQRAYQAASQVFSVVNTIMAGAINLGVETSVS